jgi:hypothetical protein
VVQGMRDQAVASARTMANAKVRCQVCDLE